jgi:glucose dehydrogenase
MKGFFRFIASPIGRVVRAVAGLILIALGVWLVPGAGGWILIVVGLVPLLAGVFDRCVFAPLFRLPFVGSRLRRAVEE